MQDTVTTLANLYEPDDIEQANAEWKCNCGPAALAAVLKIPAKAVRPLFPLFPAKPWCNPTHMMTALGLTKAKWQKMPAGCWPRIGLCFLQIEGPWENPGVPIGVAYRHTHWVGTHVISSHGRMIYDINGSQWAPVPWWEENVMSAILASNPKATGWRVRAAIEVQA